MNGAMRFIGSLLASESERLVITCHSANEKGMWVAVTLYDGDKIKGQPFIVGGKFEELDSLNDGVLARIKRYQTELLPQIDSLEALKKETIAQEAEYQKRLAKAKTEPTIAKNRCAGPCDEGVQHKLLTVSINDDAYKGLLGGANLLTILAALPECQDKARFGKLSSELKKITGHDAEETGFHFQAEEKQKSLFEVS